MGCQHFKLVFVENERINLMKQSNLLGDPP